MPTPQETKSLRAIDCWSPLITFTSKRFAIPGRAEPDDLRQEGLIQLWKVLSNHPDWEPESNDFKKCFKEYLFNNLTDVIRLQNRQCRDASREVSFTGETVETEMADTMLVSDMLTLDFIDPSCAYDSPETRVIGHDIYLKVDAELEPIERSILSMLLFPDEQYLQFCRDQSPTRLENVQKYLRLTPKEMRFHMQKIREVTANVHSDFSPESLHSVVHILALPPDLAAVPYWCVWECLDTLSRRLLAVLVFSDVPTSTTLGRLSNVLNQSKDQVRAELGKIKATIKRLFADGVKVPDKNQECRVCNKFTKLCCVETKVRGCEEHLATCQYNPKHRVVASMLAVHEESCKGNRLAIPRHCESPGCTARYQGWSIESSTRGCKKHLMTCSVNPAHRFLESERAKHEQWCRGETH